MQSDAGCVGSQIPSFREIHKNAWLKRVVAVNGNPKKATNERWWIVFCVHGDIEPYLEGYADTASATAHAPKWKAPLKHTLHVSGSVGPARPHTEYEFVITLQEGIIRLIAPTWEAMQDWVDTLRNKLREMKIISPKENVYSKPPEQTKPRAPTRDPMSPLPPPPPGPIIRVPGTEPSIRPVGSLIDDASPSCSQQTDHLNSLNDPPSAETSVSPNPYVSSNAASLITIAQENPIDNEVSNVAVEIDDNLAESHGSHQNIFSDTVSSDSVINGIEDEFFNVTQLNSSISPKVPKTSKAPDFLSNIANVSGMNICLGDSVLEEMMKNEEHKSSLFTSFDLSNDATLVQNESVGTNGTTSSTDVKIITDKYSQVDISKKSNKINIINEFPSVSNNNPSTSFYIPKIKPQVLPRKLLISENKHIVDNSAIRINDKPLHSEHIAPESNKPVNDLVRNSEKQQSSSKNALSLHFNDEALSNVTIINVAKSTTVNIPPVVHKNNPQEVEYVNFNYAACEIGNNADRKICLSLNNNDDHKSSTSGYGHIRHTTTVGVSQNVPEVAYENTKTSILNLNSGTSKIVTQTNNLPCERKELPEKSVHLKTINNIEVNSHDLNDKISVANSSTSNNTVKMNIKPAHQIDIKTESSDECYESVFNLLTAPKIPQNGSESSSSKVTPVLSEGNSLSSVFYVEHPSKKSENNDTEYEFLFWKESNMIPETLSSQQDAQRNKSEPNHTCDISHQNANIENHSQEGKHQRHGLFTRGLTEFPLISKFRHADNNQSSSKSPLLQNSQFYSYEEMDQPQGHSSTEDHGKKTGMFTSKLNNLFHLNEDKVNGTKAKSSKILNPAEKIRSESSLRRNWSEHNDRIVLPIIKNTPSNNIENSSRNNILFERSDVESSRRRSNSLSERPSNDDTHTRHETTPPNGPNNVAENTVAPILLRPMSLREQQVARLRGEMAHTGGVRLRLRSGDSPGEAMAMADVYGTVWICGWKQRTHPLLYNALHIGDRLATVGGVPITSARQAKRALKETPPGQHHVELVIKRLPHGRVFVIHRDFDNQDLGLILDGATIAGVVPNSLSARAGVSANGTLTEINGRPLNLLLKKGDTQVRDRLNAIGRDVSILLQPTEFVTLLRNSLRNMRGHKDYIVQ